MSLSSAFVTLILICVVVGLVLMASVPKIGNLKAALQSLDAQSAQVSTVTLEEMEQQSGFTPIAVGTLGPRDGDIVPIPGYGSVVLGSKAERTHGTGALAARMALMAGGGQKWDCGEDDAWLAKPMNDDAVAVMHIVEGAEHTAFITYGWNAAIAAFKTIGCKDNSGGPSGSAFAN